MFVTLLLVTFIISLVMSTIAAFLFARPITKILARLVGEELAPSWQRYILFALYIVGVAEGTRLWDMEKYITPNSEGVILQLSSDRWIIEIYKSIIGSLQGIAWMLLVFFIIALISYVIVKGFESWKHVSKAG